MSDEKALLAAIWEHPHEDTPRLMYADWLQENGQPERAEFIRVQIELARVDGWNDSRLAELERREVRLWRLHRKTWRAGLPTPLKRGLFHRGFPHGPQQAVTGKGFVEFGQAKLDAAPLWSFNFKDIHPETMPQVVRAPALVRAERLIMWQPISAITVETITGLVTPPAGNNLLTLGLKQQSIGDAGVHAFARAADLPNLLALDLTSTWITDEGIQALSEWKGAERLNELTLANNRLGDLSLDVIANGPLGRGLRTLEISGNSNITTSGLIRFIRSPAATSLHSLLIVGSSAVVPEFAEAMASSPRSQAMRRLVLYDTPLGENGVVAILNSPHLQNLQFLNVSGCGVQVGGRVAQRLDEIFGGPELGPGVGGWRRPRR